MKWIKSSECDSSACVEVAFTFTRVLVRDPRPSGPTLYFSHDEWAAFIAGAKNGEFDVEGVNR